ncbi:MAG: hypothetical protein ACK4TD_00825 [Ectopseudomonas guguanensis]|uniref:hypothetical protein n=1 Tax=Ectopseudomonas guguanensis TaxID=1198456 RepID=UPI00391C03DA
MQEKVRAGFGDADIVEGHHAIEKIEQAQSTQGSQDDLPRTSGSHRQRLAALEPAGDSRDRGQFAQLIQTLQIGFPHSPDDGLAIHRHPVLALEGIDQHTLGQAAAGL